MRKKQSMTKKLFCATLCAFLMLTTISGALATGVRMPENRGVVTDDADVLSAQMASDIAEYAKEVKDETDISLHVVIVHFLDGLDAQTYADRLFKSWNLQKDDMLILGAAGEDSFATAMGDEVAEVLGKQNAENLMFTSSTFSTLFRAQQYDAAFGRYFVAFNTLANKQCNENIKLGNLFEGYQQAQSVSPTPTTSAQQFGSQLWGEVVNAIQDSTNQYQTYHETREREGNGMSAGSWIILVIIILIIFGQSDPVRKARKKGGRNYRSYGCGCSPLGWIFSLFGINVLIDTFRRKH